RTFFDQYRAALSQNFEAKMIWRQLTSFRWLNSFLFARSLADVLRDDLLGDATIRELSVREARGDSPGLIVNTTLYNNGRRLALTTLPSAAFQYDFLRDLQASTRRRGNPGELPPILTKSWESLMPMTPFDIHADPCPMGVVGGVVASASFPPVI